jgi:phage gpG-like protein
MSLRIRDTLSPGLDVRRRGLGAGQPVLGAMGAAIVAIARGAFSDPALRPAVWPALQRPRRAHALLVQTGALRESIRVLQTTGGTVTIGSALPYAAVHQFGSTHARGRGGGISARPFFPYDASGQMTALARTRVKAVAALTLRQLLGM